MLEINALCSRPVAASGVFVSPKKVRTYVIYSYDAVFVCDQIVYLQNEERCRCLSMKLFQVVLIIPDGSSE